MFSVKKYYAGLFKTSTWGTFNTDGTQRAHGATLNKFRRIHRILKTFDRHVEYGVVEPWKLWTRSKFLVLSIVCCSLYRRFLARPWPTDSGSKF